MLITSHLFEAYLKCHTKCFLRSLGETTTENCYSDWVQDQQASYRSEEIKRFTEGAAQNQCATGPIDRENVQSAKWRFAIETTARAQNLESTIHAVARVTSEVQDKLERFIPIRFVFTNKLDKDAKLLLAFGAFVLSKLLGREVGLGAFALPADSIRCTRFRTYRCPNNCCVVFAILHPSGCRHPVFPDTIKVLRQLLIPKHAAEQLLWSR